MSSLQNQDEKERFEAAKAFVRGCVYPYLNKGCLEFNKSTFAFHVMITSGLVELRGDFSSHPPTSLVKSSGHCNFEYHFVDLLYVLALKDADFFELVCRLCAMNVYSGHELPARLRSFSAMVMTGMEPPKRVIGDNIEDWHLKVQLHVLVKDCQFAYGLNKSRDQNKKGERLSACDAVAQVFQELGLNMTFEEVHKWTVKRGNRNLKMSKQAELIRKWRFCSNMMHKFRLEVSNQAYGFFKRQLAIDYFKDVYDLLNELKK